jgi:hypothetical protein
MSNTLAHLWDDDSVHSDLMQAKHLAAANSHYIPSVTASYSVTSSYLMSHHHNRELLYTTLLL